MLYGRTLGVSHPSPVNHYHNPTNFRYHRRRRVDGVSYVQCGPAAGSFTFGSCFSSTRSVTLWPSNVTRQVPGNYGSGKPPELGIDLLVRASRYIGKLVTATVSPNKKLSPAAANIAPATGSRTGSTVREIEKSTVEPRTDPFSGVLGCSPSIRMERCAPRFPERFLSILPCAF